jgi:26S proteasome regulatory subunit N6
MAVAEPSKRIADAQKLAQKEPTKAENICTNASVREHKSQILTWYTNLDKEVLATSPGQNEAAIRDYESALIGLGELYRDSKRVDALAELVREARSVLSSFAKAKTSKLGGCCRQ